MAKKVCLSTERPSVSMGSPNNDVDTDACRSANAAGVYRRGCHYPAGFETAPTEHLRNMPANPVTSWKLEACRLAADHMVVTRRQAISCPNGTVAVMIGADVRAVPG